jgi:hypothetical protein
MNKCPKTGRVIPSRVSPGDKFNKWTAISFSHKNSGGNNVWTCQCECGAISQVLACRLVSGKSLSCKSAIHMAGRNKKHGLRNHPLYQVWRGIKYRCLDPSAHNYEDYGGRGIGMCDRWKESVENFYNDMVSGYKRGLHIGRIDNNGNYEPGNCRWETPIQNMNNKRSNVYVTHDGRTHTPAEWARELFIKANTIQNRIRKGRKDYDALFGDSSK